MSAEQMTIDAAGEVDVPRTPLPERYEAWKAANPHALTEVARTTRELWNATGRKPTIARVWEELRDRVYTTGEPYRWDNSFRSFAARDVMDLHPDLAGTFRTRRSKADHR